MAIAKLGMYDVAFDNSQEYHLLKQEIFTHNCYYFETDTPRPKIIDAGAHIGLATLYFKKNYPTAEIIAIEPLPENFQLLTNNVERNQLENVTLINKALAPVTNSIVIYADTSNNHWFSTAGIKAGAWNGQQNSRQTNLPALPLTDFLTSSVDFMKMDIEAAEQDVLIAAGSQLRQIRHMIIEFHPVANQSLTQLIQFLKQLGFRVHVDHENHHQSFKSNRSLVLIEAKLINT